VLESQIEGRRSKEHALVWPREADRHARLEEAPVDKTRQQPRVHTCRYP